MRRAATGGAMLRRGRCATAVGVVVALLGHGRSRDQRDARHRRDCCKMRRAPVVAHGNLMLPRRSVMDAALMVTLYQKLADMALNRSHSLSFSFLLFV
jgi:hypothetical protein